MSDVAVLPQDQADRLVREVVTPEGVVVHVRLAAASARLGALILDLAILIVALMAVGLLTLFAGGHLGRTAGLLALFGLRSFYFSGFELAWNGRTPGKRMTGLRVVNRRGGTLMPAAVIARNLMREVELFLPLSIAISGGAGIATDAWSFAALLIWVCVLAFLPVFNHDRLRAGDMVAGTWVIVEPKPALLPELVSEATGAAYRFTTQQLTVYGVKELQVLEEVLRSPSASRQALECDVAQRIARKIGYPNPEAAALDAGKFLEAFYAAQRRRLEAELAFGRRRRDKYDA
ncbi:MAG TPA: RDD family protein [Reyranella sp.]|nr:RDD family protein [Reyranella sp.]